MLKKILPASYQRLRLRSKLSRKQFAVQAGLSLNTLVNYENGQTRPELKGEAKLLAAPKYCAS